MTTDLMEELLNEEESSSLDFKLEQYPFVGAVEHQKDELLKDILAFANAWRRTEAYILIGVEDVKGGRSIVHGVTSHFDDASIQQFVNAKTNRPVSFSYEVFRFENVQVGVFCFPVQDRPIYLKNNYGKLRKNEVHIRRGSSSAIAEPDEIAKMGASKSENSVVQTKPNPIIDILRIDFEKQNTVLVEVIVHAFDRNCFQGKVYALNNIYATFRHEGHGGHYSSALSHIILTGDLSVNMNKYSLLPLA